MAQGLLYLVSFQVCRMVALPDGSVERKGFCVCCGQVGVDTRQGKVEREVWHLTHRPCWEQVKGDHLM